MEGVNKTNSRGVPRPDGVVEFRGPDQARRLSARELRVETPAAALVLVAATALVLLASSSRTMDAGVLVVMVLTYGVAARVRLCLGAGYAMPNQFVLVPMLYLLAADSVPLIVAGTLAGTAVLDTLLGRAHPERILTAVADAWHVLGGALVFVLAGEPEPVLSSWWGLAPALAAQFPADLVAPTPREGLRPGLPPPAVPGGPRPAFP